MVRFGSAVQDEENISWRTSAVERSWDCEMVAGALRVLFAPRDLQPCTSGVLALKVPTKFDIDILGSSICSKRFRVIEHMELEISFLLSIEKGTSIEIPQHG